MAAGFGSLLGVVVVAVVFGLAPQALEPFRISPLILGGVGLTIGTLAGRAGLSGVVRDQMRSWRRRRAEAAAREIDRAAAVMTNDDIEVPAETASYARAGGER